MRKYSKYLILLLIVFTMGACKNNKKDVRQIEEDVLIPASMVTTQKDTAEVTSLVNKFIAYMKMNNVDGAMSMLYYLDKGSTIKQMPEKLAKSERTVLNTFKGLDYSIDRLVFNKETDCEAKITVTLFKKDKGDTRPNEIGIMIKPVRRDGKWYLTMSDSETDSTHGSEIQN